MAIFSKKFDDFIEKHYTIIYLIATVGIGFWLAYTKGWIMADFKKITSKEAFELIKKDYPIFDVRTKEEYNNGHIKGAILIPYDELYNKKEILDKYINREVIVYSKTGRIGISASRELSKIGIKPLNVVGGMISLSMEGGKKYPFLFESIKR